MNELSEIMLKYSTSSHAYSPSTGVTVHGESWPLLPLFFIGLGHAVAQWLRHYATSRKVTGSRPHKAILMLSVYLTLPVALGPGFYSDSNRH
jgi:hypothetical protein